jgi:hypothetical protein
MPTRHQLHSEISALRKKPRQSVGRGGKKTFYNAMTRKYETAKQHYARLGREARTANKRRRKARKKA